MPKEKKEMTIDAIYIELDKLGIENPKDLKDGKEILLLSNNLASVSLQLQQLNKAMLKVINALDQFGGIAATQANEISSIKQLLADMAGKKIITGIGGLKKYNG